jgi:cbb3-type cytochrome oxidase maturation protein
MSVLILLLIASISVSSIFLFAFLWSVRNHQFDDDYSPPVRILFDDGTELSGFRDNSCDHNRSDSNPTNADHP